MHRTPGLLALLLSAGLATWVGCGESRFTVVPVSGTVTLNGEPLADAFVTFDPRATEDDRIAGPGSFGRTDAQGRYELETYDGQAGAVLAEHQVSIRTMLTEEDANGDLQVVRDELLPRRYHENSQLTFSVPEGGTEQADFALTVEN